MEEVRNNNWREKEIVNWKEKEKLMNYGKTKMIRN